MNNITHPSFSASSSVPPSRVPPFLPSFCASTNNFLLHANPISNQTALCHMQSMHIMCHFVCLSWELRYTRIHIIPSREMMMTTLHGMQSSWFIFGRSFILRRRRRCWMIDISPNPLNFIMLSLSLF
jgi:hypothetical protein